MSTSQKAFKKNIASFIEILESQGFVLEIKTYDDEIEQDILESTKAKKDFLLNLNLDVEHDRDLLDNLTWSKNIAHNQTVYAHISIEASTHMSSTTRVRDIKALITDDLHGFACQKYRKINIPSTKVLIKRIAEVESDLITTIEARNTKEKAIKRNIPIIQEEMKNVFGEDAEISHSLVSGCASVDYLGVEVKCYASSLDMKVSVDIFGKKDITLTQARDIIDILYA
tara:strand:- start:86604 stop:87284 length:681 start_codon:yes stop_codon:yes gene_type:complete